LKTETDPHYKQIFSWHLTEKTGCFH